MERTASSATRDLLSAVLVLAALPLAGCDETKKIVRTGDDPDPAPTPTEVAPDEDAPTIAASVLALSGATGPAGAFLVGDRIAVHFRVAKANGDPWAVDEFAEAEAMVSGPTVGYQRVIPVQTDVADRVEDLGDGEFRYAFPPLPAVYAAPYNDTPSFTADDGERTGEPLVDGTYTLGLSFVWEYTVDGVPFRRVGEVTEDFLVGPGAGMLQPREVSLRASCNRCHVDVAGHDGRYRDLTGCLLCHTSGAEDANDMALGGGTPGVTIDATVMFHQIHSGKHLPSVIGVGTLPDGFRDYDRTPEALVYASPDRGLRDYSQVGWPVMPNLIEGVARDDGYGDLDPEHQAMEDLVRTGPTNCEVCHGDPDGDGPLGLPAQSELIFAQQTRKSCGSCHDDIDWLLPYRANIGIMEEQFDDTTCIDCHFDGSGYSPREDHYHPLQDRRVYQGTNVELVSVAEAGNHDGDGTFDPGERIELTLDVVDDDGDQILKANVAILRVLLAGPTSNHQLVVDAQVLQDQLVGARPWTVRVPEKVSLELLGESTTALGDVFDTSRAPLWRRSPDFGLFLRTGTLETTTTVDDATAGELGVDVDDASAFLRDDYVAIDDGAPGLVEYARVVAVEGSRLWLREPLKRTHPAGAAVARVTLEVKQRLIDYNLDETIGQVSERREFGDGVPVILTYTTELELPDRYPEPPNASDDLTDATGKWAGKSLVDGTYTLGVSATQEVDYFFLQQELTPYLGTSDVVTRELLVGSATTVEPRPQDVLGASCNDCHFDLAYHGGEHRGYESCVLCHGGGGVEDLPTRVAPNAPATTGRRADFRALIHRIHRDSSDADPSWSFVGEGSAAFPDNFEVETWRDVVYPADPGGAQSCAQCHLFADTAAILPRDRSHPTEQVHPVDVWAAACEACHDTQAASAHIASQTAPSGAESCLICHDLGEESDVVQAHRVR